ncbi:MAG: transposase [Patescibacteria group bacterium]
MTTKTFKNKPLFIDEKCCGIVLKDIEFYRQKLGFRVVGYCLMPDHLHLIVWWDADEHKGLTISKIVQAIKGHSAKEIINYMKTGRRKPSLSPSSAASAGSRLPKAYRWINRGHVHTPGTEKIWQPSFYDFNIYSEKKLLEKLAYIHDNPRRAGLVMQATDYPFSSARNYFMDDHSEIFVNTSLC